MRSTASPRWRGYFFQSGLFSAAGSIALSLLVNVGTIAASDGLTLTTVQRAQLALLHGAESEGLEPSDYALAELEQCFVGLQVGLGGDRGSRGGIFEAGHPGGFGIVPSAGGEDDSEGGDEGNNSFHRFRTVATSRR